MKKIEYLNNVQNQNQNFQNSQLLHSNQPYTIQKFNQLY